VTATATSRRKSKSKSNRKPAETRYPTAGLATIAQACEFLSISRSTLYEAIKKGRVSTVTPPIGSDKRINWEHLWDIARQRGDA